MKKLAPETRRAILAAARIGVPLAVIQRALQLNRDTVRSITREDLPNYDDLYAEWNAIGMDAFVLRYLTPAFVGLLNQHVKTGRIVHNQWRDDHVV